MAVSATETNMVTVGVVGLGRMGMAISGMLALRGFHVKMYDNEFARGRAKALISASIAEYVKERMVTQAEKDEAVSRLEVVDNLSGMASVAVVFEAIYEDLEAKRQMFRELAACVPPNVILATNTINLEIKDVFCDIHTNPFCGVRFLHPVYFIEDVEVSAEGDQTYTGPSSVWKLLGGIGMTPFIRSEGQQRIRLTPTEWKRFHQQRQESMSSISLDSFQTSSAQVGEDCTLCMEKPANAILFPCGHQGVCLVCAERVMSQKPECPMCRLFVDKVLEAA